MRIKLTNKAFTLVEVTLAMGMAASCLLGVVALLPVGINSNRDSINTTHAASITRGILADLDSTPESENSVLYQLQPDTLTQDTVLYLKEDGTRVEAAPDADFRVLLDITPPATGIAPTTVRVCVSWPAEAVRAGNVYEVVTALDRN